MPESELFRELISNNGDPGYTDTCIQLTSLSGTLQMANELVMHCMRKITKKEIVLVKDDVARIRVTDAKHVRMLKKLNESQQIKLNTLLEFAAAVFGLYVEVCAEEVEGKADLNYFLEVMKMFPDYEGDGPFDPGGGGDDNVEPHAEIVEEKPMTMAMAAGAR